MRLLQLQFCCVFAGDDPFGGVNKGGHRIEQRRLTRARAAGNDDVAATRPDNAEDAGALGADRLVIDQVTNGQLVLAEFPNG